MFAKCRELGLHVVAHAGEEGPPAYVESALDVLKVERIDHGVRCVESPALVQRLAATAHAADGLPAVQPQAVRVQVAGRAPWPTLLDAGLCVTVNSDDPAYFGGYINENFVQTFDALPALDTRHAGSWRPTASRPASPTPAHKTQWLQQLDAAFAKAAAPGFEARELSLPCR